LMCSLQRWILLEPLWFCLQIIYIARFVFHLCRVLLLRPGIILCCIFW
jgi:hypothetical protein